MKYLGPPTYGCEEDAWHTHYWEKISAENGYLFWRCTQCHLFFKEKIHFLKEGNE